MVKRIARLGGAFFTLICVLFLVFQVRRYWGSIQIQVKGEVLLYAIAVGAAFYALACFFLSFAWYFLASTVGGTLPFYKVHKIYAKSQIAKYIPGNIFHYGSRQVLGHKAGMSHTSTFLVNLLEALVIVGAAAGISVAGGVGFVGHRWGVLSMALALVISVAVSLLVVVLLPKLATRAPRFVGVKDISEAIGSSYTLAHRIRLLVLPMVCYVTFFALMGLFLWLLAMVCFPNTVKPHNLPLFLSAYAGSWVVGFLTPGAPGGMGVREALLSVGLSPVVGKAGGLALALSFRLVTVLGDGLFYMTSYFLRAGGESSSPNQ